MLQLIQRAEAFARDTDPPRPAIIDGTTVVSYRQLLDASARVAERLLVVEKGADLGRCDLQERRVALLVPPGPDFVAVLWGIWRAGGIAVPLCLSHPRPELEHVLRDSGAGTLVAPADGKLGRLARELTGESVCLRMSAELLDASRDDRSSLPDLHRDRRALLIYTSGTTGKPKGVVWHHGMLEVQMQAMTDAWGWSAEDHIVGVLPLHHVHGLVNVQTTALWNGGSWQPLDFDAEAVWHSFESTGERGRPHDVTVFMAVPTVYVRLLAAWDAAPPLQQHTWSQAAARLRLMVSGSAALPVDIFERWHQVTGHALLERYGMSEIGMALSNPLDGERVPGHVGWPMPGVEVRLVPDSGVAENRVAENGVDENGIDIQENPSGEAASGEIWVRGPGIFREYWQRPDETAAAFRDGWFVTGDVAVKTEQGYRILGRRSVDILKSGGYKLSALEIEAELRRHPDVDDCAVVGVPDAEWGERVGVALLLRPGTSLSLDALRDWGRSRLAPYKLPTRLRIVDDLPRNALGKVVKPQVRELFE